MYIYQGAFESQEPYGDAGSAYGYGYGYGYSSYANRYMKLYGKWADNGKDVDFKIVLDDTAFAQFTDGEIETTCSFLMPEVITLSDATFDVNPEPVLSVINSFNTADDS